METEEQPTAEEQPILPTEPPMEEMEQTALPDVEHTAETPPSPEPPALAEPGVYVCIHENAGEHAILGRLDFGEEYDYTATQDPRTLEAVAACVAGGYLEKV